jgi:hypothetical protein
MGNTGPLQNRIWPLPQEKRPWPPWGGCRAELGFPRIRPKTKIFYIFSFSNTPIAKLQGYKEQRATYNIFIYRS